MTKTELTDNLMFLSALKQLEQLVDKGVLSEREAAQTRRELEHRFRPTLLMA